MEEMNKKKKEMCRTGCKVFLTFEIKCLKFKIADKSFFLHDLTS